jgi:hypothetical protein
MATNLVNFDMRLPVTAEETLFTVCRLYGAFCAHLGFEPNHALLRNGSVDPLAQGHDVHLACPNPQARRKASQSERAKHKTQKFQRGNAYVVKESRLC